jgi:hypothetical protein
VAATLSQCNKVADGGLPTQPSALPLAPSSAREVDWKIARPDEISQIDFCRCGAA